MKKQFFFIFFLFILFSTGVLAKSVKLISREASAEIDLERIKTVDFVSKKAIYDLIKDILPSGLMTWKNTNLNRTALILLKHEFNAEHVNLKNPVEVRKAKIKRLAESIKTLENELSALEASDVNKKGIFDRRAIKTEIENLKKEKYKLKYWFFEIEEKINAHVLHKEKGNWSSNLFGTRRFLIVLLGGWKDLALADMSVEGKSSAFKQSFIQLDTTPNSEDKTTYKVKVNAVKSKVPFSDKISCRFVEIDRKFVKPPCTIFITVRGPGAKENVFKFKVIEKNIVQFKIGIASSHLKKLKVTFDNGKITAVPHEDDAYQVKENLFFMLDFHLPRNMEQFRPPFLKPWENFKKRFGMFIGLKLSADPLSSIFLGLSFSLSRHINLIGGIVVHNEIKPTVTDIGDIGSLEEAREYLFRRYSSPKFFWGLSISPLLIPKVLGINF